VFRHHAQGDRTHLVVLEQLHRQEHMERCVHPMLPRFARRAPRSSTRATTKEDATGRPAAAKEDSSTCGPRSRGTLMPDHLCVVWHRASVDGSRTFFAPRSALEGEVRAERRGRDARVVVGGDRCAECRGGTRTAGAAYGPRPHRESGSGRARPDTTPSAAPPNRPSA
jgi:hypothetical protein